MCYSASVALRTCRAVVTDAEGVEHSVEILAESLFEAVGLALHALDRDQWVAEIPSPRAVKVSVREPAIEHLVPLPQFQSWLGATCRSPQEKILKERLQKLLAG